MASSTLFPSRETDLLAWFQHLVAGIGTSPGPAGYNVTTAQLTQLTTLVDNYGAALAASGPAVRTKATTLAKRAAADAARAYTKLIVNSINASPTVTASQKAALGLPIPKVPTPTPIPSDSPRLTIDSMNGWTMKLSATDSGQLRKNRKPAGVAGVMLFSAVGGANAPTDLNLYKFEGSTTRTTFDVVIDSSVAPGSPVHFVAFWFNSRQQSGPLCSPITGYVQYGSVAKKAA